MEGVPGFVVDILIQQINILAIMRCFIQSDIQSLSPAFITLIINLCFLP